MKAQNSADRYRKMADIIIENNKSVDLLKEKVKKIIAYFK
jgi:dephospho-CoA kinase